jgi:hypothetical protein
VSDPVDLLEADEEVLRIYEKVQHIYEVLARKFTPAHAEAFLKVELEGCRVIEAAQHMELDVKQVYQVRRKIANYLINWAASRNGGDA